MAAGLILADDQVNVFVLDRKLEQTPENTANVELLKDMDQKVFTNSRENPDLEFLETAEVAAKLAECDSVIPY